MPTQFPFEKMWSFQNVEHQIAMELSYFNWYQIVQELPKAFGAFATLLMKILHASETEIEINQGDAKKFLELYFGNGKNKSPLDRGLYAYDIVQREFEEKYTVLCRGYDEKITPASHHQIVMMYFKKMYPLLWKLWHQIANQIEIKDGGIPQKWLRDALGLTTEEKNALHLEDQQLIERGQLIQMTPLEELEAIPLGSMEDEDE